MNTKAAFQGKLTYANVVATTCLFVTLGGGAYAAAALPASSVGTREVRDGSLRMRDMASRERTVSLHVRLDTGGANLAGSEPGSPGDLVAFDNKILDGAGKEIGRNLGHCVSVNKRSRTCVETYTLPGGQVHIVGTTETGSGAAVVVGGTGKFSGATGTLPPATVDRDGTYVNTLHLRLPR